MLYWIYERALKQSEIINKHVDNLYEFKFQHKNVLKHCVLRQKYLRYDYLGLLILCANDAEIYRKLQDNFWEWVEKTFSFYKAD